MNAVLEQEIIQRLHTLDEPKLVEVLDFVDFLAQRRRAVITPSTPGLAEAQPKGDAQASFYDLTQEFCGCVEGGPSDLSTNPKYLESFGE